MRSALIDLTIVAAGFLLAFFGAELAGLAHAGACAVLAGVLLASWRLKANAESWRTVGVRAPERWGRLALSVVALYVLIVAGTLLVIEPLSRVFDWPRLNLAGYAHLQGNPQALAHLLAIVWTTAAIGEELLFRGFLLTRLEQILGRGLAPMIGAVVLQAAIFGAAHSYLGPRGVATAMLVGLVFGFWFARRGRNLLPLMIAHGLTDTISVFAIYAGVMPQ